MRRTLGDQSTGRGIYVQLEFHICARPRYVSLAFPHPAFVHPNREQFISAPTHEDVHVFGADILAPRPIFGASTLLSRGDKLDLLLLLIAADHRQS